MIFIIPYIIETDIYMIFYNILYIRNTRATEMDVTILDEFTISVFSLSEECCVTITY